VARRGIPPAAPAAPPTSATDAGVDGPHGPDGPDGRDGPDRVNGPHGPDDAPSTGRSATRMGAITAVSRLLGFARVLAVAAVLGTTDLGDAFQASNSVSNVLFELLAAGALSAVLVPTFVDLLDRGDGRRAEEVAGRVLGVALAVLGAVTVVGVVAAPLLARALTTGVDPEVADDQRDLVTFLLRFFVPQVMLYAAGTVAAAVLYAKRRFPVTAAAPIGNTVIMVICLGVFTMVAGSDPGLDLSSGERWLLVLAGTGGVLGFVGILLAACAASGFRLRPRRLRGDQRVAGVLRHSGWGVALHTAGGLLLGAAIVCASGVEGAVVAYQAGWVFFLAPYAVLAQPIHTAILPELVVEARESGPDRVARSLRWGLERMGLLVLPVAAAMTALALPGMRLIRLGETSPELLAAAVAGLAVGLFPYSAFLLFSLGYYALGESRWPGLVAVGAAAVGVVVMVVGRVVADGTARVAVLGLGHSVAYGLGAVVLGVGLSRRAGSSLWPVALVRMTVVSVAVGVAAWAASRSVLGTDPGRVADLAVLAAVGVVGGALVLGGYRALGVPGTLTPRTDGADR
jgi:putative peptidoglycan lipid II flippase